MDLHEKARELVKRVEMAGIEVEEAVEVAREELARAASYPVGKVKAAEAEVAGFGTGLLGRLDAVRAQGAARRVIAEKLRAS